MNLQEINNKREELRKQIEEDKSAIAQLSARIQVACEQMGIEPTEEAIAKALKEAQEQESQAEAQAQECLNELKALQGE